MGGLRKFAQRERPFVFLGDSDFILLLLFLKARACHSVRVPFDWEGNGVGTFGFPCASAN